MATRLLTKQALLPAKQVSKRLNRILKDFTKQEFEHELGENLDATKQNPRSVVSLLSAVLNPTKDYPIRPVPSGFVDMQRRLGSQDSKLSSSSKMSKALQLPEKPKWRQMLVDLKEELDEEKKKLRGGMNRKSKKKRRNQKKKRHTRRRG